MAMTWQRRLYFLGIVVSIFSYLHSVRTNVEDSFEKKGNPQLLTAMVLGMIATLLYLPQSYSTSGTPRERILFLTTATLQITAVCFGIAAFRGSYKTFYIPIALLLITLSVLLVKCVPEVNRELSKISKGGE